MAMDWARLYRPKDFDTYVGNTIIKNKVQSMFKNDRVPQTLLLQGDRGCGKTTLARLMAKNLMCKNRTSQGLACDNCSSCDMLNEKFISTGEAPNGMSVFEVDITKSNKTEDATGIVEMMRKRTIGKTNRVFILDEIQRASPQAQNSYLKIAEEPGENLYIILCTTDPEDLIDAFKSRFNVLPVKRPGIKEIVDRLEFICRDQNVKYDKEGLRLIASQSGRIPRESIKQLAMVATNAEATVSYDRVVEELQMVKIDLYHEFMMKLEADVFQAIQFIDDLHEEKGVDWADFLKQFSDYMIDVFNMKVGVRLDKYSDEEYKKTRKLLAKYTSKDISRFLVLIEDALKSKESPRFVLTMLTLRMGYPEYLGSLDEASKNSDRANEHRQGMTNYRKEKDAYKLKQEEQMDKQDEQVAEDELVNQMMGAEAVEGLEFLQDVEIEEDGEEEK